MRTLLLLTTLFIAAPSNAAVYQWQDANGNIVYGDAPPEFIGAVEIELPALTVADSYFTDRDKQKKADAADGKASTEETSKTVPYKHFSVKSPTQGAALRANNGNIIVQFELQPALQEGHGLVVYLDGKQVASKAATVFSLKELDRGSHSLFAVVHDANNDVLKNTQAVKFNVLRTAKR